MDEWCNDIAGHKEKGWEQVTTFSDPSKFNVKAKTDAEVQVTLSLSLIIIDVIMFLTTYVMLYRLNYIQQIDLVL
jgi:hypothetical protein